MANIKDVILKKGMTIKSVAEKMGISQQAFSQLLQREKDLEDNTLQRIADAIGCDISELKKSGRGRPVTAYKVPLMVRITKEAYDMIEGVKNRSEFIDTLIKESGK